MSISVCMECVISVEGEELTIEEEDGTKTLVCPYCHEPVTQVSEDAPER